LYKHLKAILFCVAFSKTIAHQHGLTREKAAIYFLLVFSHDGAFEDSYQLSLLGHIPYLQMVFISFFSPNPLHWFSLLPSHSTALNNQ